MHFQRRPWTHPLCFLILAILLSAAAEADQIEQQAEEILETARDTNSSALLILRNGKPVVEYYGDDEIGLLETMSVTKSVVALGMARMLTTGELESLDTPVAEYFPEWRQGKKRDITIRHLLNHTSGLQNVKRTSEEIYPSPDFVQLALAAELEHDPGEHFSYNNKAVNLIAGLFPLIVDQRMDHYIADQIFTPLGIEDWNWTLDDAGNPHGMSGLELHPRSLAGLGQLVLNEGQVDGKEVIAPDILERFLEPGSRHASTSGLLWWRQPAEESYLIDEKLLQRYEEAGVGSGVIDTMRSIQGSYSGRHKVVQALTQAFGSDWQQDLMPEIAPHQLAPARARSSDEIVAWVAKGYLGQFLVIVPGKNIVAVRMVEPFEGVGPEHGFTSFPELVAELGKP